MQRLRDLLNRSDRPNTFTREMGKLIRQAREQQGMSQEELAAATYRSRPAISEMESGKMEPDASTLVYLALALEKPILYFFPAFARQGLPEDLSPEAQEMLDLFTRLDTDPLRKAALRQLRALADLDE